MLKLAQAITSLFNSFLCKVSETITLLFKRLFSSLHSWRPPHTLLWVKRRLTSYDLYGSQLEEDLYWRSASSGQRRLQVSNAHYVKHASRGTILPPLVMSYVPSLLPTYRESRKDTPRNDHLSPQAFCKWHRMVFPNNVHPTMIQASKLRWNYTPGDRRVMRRISRMLPNKEVFLKEGCIDDPRYRNIWRNWLDSKPPGGELEIVFE